MFDKTKHIVDGNTYRLEHSATGVSCTSTMRYLGYTYEELQCFQADGFTYYINGREAKFPTAAQYAKGS